MQNCILAYPDYMFPDSRYATVAVSGGSWQAALPLANLLTLRFSEIARSTNVALASTQFWVDLGTVRDVLVIAVPRTNGSRACQIRVRGFQTQSVSGKLVVDTGWQMLYPRVYPPLTLYWGKPSLWDGQMSPEDFLVWPMPWTFVFSLPQNARYWFVEFNDTTNSAGYLQLPRILFAPGYKPSFNFAYGVSILNNDATPVQNSLGGADYFDPRTRRRVARFSISYLPEDEAEVWANDMQYKLGISGQLYFLYDQDKPMHAHRRHFLARMSTLSPLECAVHGRMSTTYELTEIVA